MTNTVDLDGGWTFRAEDIVSTIHTITFELHGAPALLARYGRAPFIPDRAVVFVQLAKIAEDSGDLVAERIDLEGYRAKKDGSVSASRITDATWWRRTNGRYDFDREEDHPYILAVAAHAVETVKAMLR